MGDARSRCSDPFGLCSTHTDISTYPYRITSAELNITNARSNDANTAGIHSSRACADSHNFDIHPATPSTVR